MAARLGANHLFRAVLVIWACHAIWWATSAYRYYFDFQPQDAVAMSSVLLIAAFIIKVVRDSRMPPKHAVWFVGTIVLLHFALKPLLDLLILETNESWFIIYGYLVAVGGAMGLFWHHPKQASMMGMASMFAWLIPYSNFVDQQYYYDKLVGVQETKRGLIHVVQWKKDTWVHYNRNLSVSSVDAHMYYEPLVHPTMHLAPPNAEVLLLGGDNGYVLAELEKYAGIHLDVVPFDGEFLRTTSDVDFRDQELFAFVTGDSSTYDVIVIDLPDPVNVHTNQYYSREFYEACHTRLNPNGLLVSQAGSPYLQATIFHTILKTLEESKFQTVPIHNQVPSLGQWGWVIASKGSPSNIVKEHLSTVIPSVQTVWWDQEAMQMMLSFGKEEFFHTDDLQVNTMENPTLVNYRRSQR